MAFASFDIGVLNPIAAIASAGSLTYPKDQMKAIATALGHEVTQVYAYF